jgi:hypothetical protein
MNPMVKSKTPNTNEKVIISSFLFFINSICNQKIENFIIVNAINKKSLKNV